MKYSIFGAALLSLAGVQALVIPRLHVQIRNAEEHLTTFRTEDTIPADRTVDAQVESVATGTVEILPSLTDVQPHTEGAVFTEVSSINEGPLMTSKIPEPTSLLKPVESSTGTKDGEARATGLGSEQGQNQDIFASPIDTIAPSFPVRDDHPVPRTGIDKSGPIHTNKFYSGFFLADQTTPVYTTPYALSWSKGGGPASSWGIAISHTEADQRVYGDKRFNDAVSYYTNPVGIQSMIMSAAELGNGSVLTTDSLTSFSAQAHLRPGSGLDPVLTLPIVQGMPFVTGLYSGSTPIIQTGIYYRTLTRVELDPKTNVQKYLFALENGATWVLYSHSTDGSPLELQLVNQGLVQAAGPFTGTVQIAKVPEGADSLFDRGAGIYPTGITLGGSVSGSTGTYSLGFSSEGHGEGSLFMYALPHHVESFDPTTAGQVSEVQIQTPAKGIATLVEGTIWTMEEAELPTDMDFAPWNGGSQSSLSAAAQEVIRPVAELEISQNMDDQSDLDSVYYSGKALLKFAQIAYTVNDLLNDPALAQAGLVNLKTAFDRWAKNEQAFPLTYESAWGGVVSTASYTTGEPIADFGNSYYNDHHFHYGYHILAAAYIGYLDSSWIESNREYVNALVRDIATPAADEWFPQYRNFDWFSGHSWAHGLFPAADGKNQESSSEDVMAVYAVKMWAKVTGDAAMEARADLQLAVLARALRNYYYYTEDNKVQPAEFIGNKVAGILFENKVDHTTFFSADIEAIQGIHMIPIHGPSAYTRSKQFVQEEWDAFFSDGRIDDKDNAWKGIAYANLALVDAQASWNFFADPSFSVKWIDGGASRTWYLAFAAALGGA